MGIQWHGPCERCHVMSSGLEVPGRTRICERCKRQEGDLSVNRATLEAEAWVLGALTRDNVRAARAPSACLYCTSPRRDDGTGHCPSCGSPL